MKVLDLQCGLSHVFEGWFSCEDDFLRQREAGLVECPVCGDASITKRLSAPRLNLMAARTPGAASQELVSLTGAEPTLQDAWMALARRVLLATDDVGERFAEEARKRHYGETAPNERGIRGTASPAQAQALLDEGIAVLPLAMPPAFKGPLQ